MSSALTNSFGKGMISYPDLVSSAASRNITVKFMRYRNFNKTLTDYILVSQIEPHIEHFFSS